jgi:hypothetical protein
VSNKEWLLSEIGAAFRIKFEGDIIEWADSRLKIPYSTRYPVYAAEESPWLLEPLRAACDPKVRRVDVRGPAGSAKSLIGEMHIAYVVDNSPGFYYYVHQKDDAGQQIMEERILPMFLENDFLAAKLPVDPNKRRVGRISFPTMQLYALGANYNNAQSKRVKYLTMEEPHAYEAGLMKAFEKRCEGVRGAKILTLSTGSILGDESDAAYNDGTCEEWEVPCPHCGHFQRMTDDRDRLRCDRTTDTTDEQGNIIWHKLLPTVRYNCEECGRDWPTDDEFRRTQAQSGRYTVTNPNAPADHRSFHWEATAIHWMRLSDILKDKLEASHVAKMGSLEPLRDYIQKRRALAWDDSPPQENGDEGTRMKGVYHRNFKDPDEIARFMTVDNQAGRASKGEGAHRWFVCRSYTKTESKLVDCGRLTTWEDVEEKRIELGVEPGRTLVDTAWDAVNVQSVCVRYGWQGLWGDNTNKKSFPHHETVNNQRVVRQYPFSSVNIGHVGLGSSGATRQARYFFWSQQTIKNLYHRLKNGLTAYKWTVPQDCPDVYFEHIKNEYKRSEINARGERLWVWYNPPKKPNHLLDACEMNLVAALMDPRIRALLLSTEDTPTIALNPTDHEAKQD